MLTRPAPLRAPESVRGPQRRLGERGQVAMSLISIALVGLVALAFFGIYLFGRGVNDKTQSQTAADAAALAGAQDLVGSVTTLLAGLTAKDLGGVGGCNAGKNVAESYAEKNDAALTDYCFDSRTGEVAVSVRLDHEVAADLGPATASAVASTGLDLADCRWEDDEEETPTSSPSPSADPSDSGTPPPPPPDVPTTLTCGGLVVRYVIDGTTGQLRLDGAVDLDDLTPHLVE